jgi:DNA polymerase III delta prime subunit
MNLIQQHIDKDNLHHAYLIEGDREEVVAEVISIMESLGIEVSGNSDFVRVSADSFKVDDARNLKSFAGERASSAGKKIFLISANNFLLEAQNTLLKTFEEPIENTHFFLTVPDTSALLGTFLSRFYLIKTKEEVGFAKAEEFIKMPLARRIDFIKELLQESEDEDEEGNEIIVLNSARAKALKFLNAVESVMHPKVIEHPEVLQHIFKVRKFLRMPGSSAKSLMESVALVVPKF